MSETLQVEKRRLWELAKEGKSADEIMQTLNIKDMGTPGLAGTFSGNGRDSECARVDRAGFGPC